MVYNERGRTGRINFVYKMHNLKEAYYLNLWF